MRVERFGLEDGGELLDRFVELPFRIHEDDPRWIAPFELDTRRQLSSENLFFRHGEIESFVALGDRGEPLARCSAIVNRDLRHEGELAGLVGFYESVNDAAASDAVLGAALEHLRARGLSLVLGPMQFSIWHTYRLMTRGFETSPFLGEPYNPRWYPELFARAGFAPLARWCSWDLSDVHVELMLAATEGMRSQQVLDEGFTMETLRLDRFEQDLRRLHDLLTDGFKENLAYSELPFDEFATIFGPMRLLVRPELVPFCLSPEGEAVGCAYLYPDYGPALRAMKGDASLFPNLPRFLLKEPADRLVFHTVMLKKEYRKRGIIETFLGPVLRQALESGFTHGIGALAKEGPTIYSKTGEPTREYVLYSARVK